MKLNTNVKADVNYLSKIVQIDNFTQHINPEVTRLKVAHVDGYTILVGIDEEPGKFVYFPAMSCINPQLLSYANLYRHAEMNADTTKTGLFEDNGRVKAVKLKGQVSEGFLLPLQTLINFIVDSTSVAFDESDCPVGTEFNEVEHKGKSFWISKKYVVRNTQSNGSGDKHMDRRQKGLKKFNRVIDTQFRFHYSTTIIRKEPEVIRPDDLISITSKWHGTSAIFAYVKCKHPLTWKEKIAKFLTKNEFEDYDYIYASRSVVKNANITGRKYYPGFYGEGNDVWAEAFKVVKPFLAKGMTIYAEIVGYLPSGKAIQKTGDVYDYGCVLPKPGEEYTYGKHYKIMVYRITMTNVDGLVHEFSAREVQQWCKVNGLVPVIEYYYGYAKDLYPEIPADAPDYGQQFIDHLADEKRFNMEMNSPECVNKVAHEGLVIKKEDMMSRAWKLKCFKFLNKEQDALDKGEENIEDLA
jgi:hypothetical protein